MITCPKCKRELADDAKFCDACGAQIPEDGLRTECGEQKNSEPASFQSCKASPAEDASEATSEGVPEAIVEEAAKGNAEGEAESASATAEPAATPSAATTQETRVPQPRSKKGIIFAVLGIIAIVAIILAAAKIGGGSGKGSYCLYLKDSEIFYNDYSKATTVQISSRLTAGEKLSNLELSAASYSIGSFTTFNNDGSRIFFPDRIAKDSDGVTLYYRDLKKPDQEAVKIDSDIKLYAIDTKGTKIAYLKGSDNVLYLNDFSDKEKIASGVYSFNVDDDLKKIGYYNDEDSYYIWYADKDSVKIASDITYIERIAPDLSKVYYMKDGSLYRYSESSGDKEKIASDVSGIVSIYDSGEVYYTRGEYVEKPLIEFVEDDMAEYDAGISEPEYPEYPEAPEYPYWWNYSTNEAYEAAVAQYDIDYAAYEVLYDQIYDAYSIAYDEFWDKIFRDYMREDLEYETMYVGEFELYYFDGKEEHLVTDKLVDDYDLTVSYEKPIAVIRAYGQSGIPKIKLSEIENYYEVTERVDEARSSSTERYVTVGRELSLLEQREGEYFVISPDFSAVYFFDDPTDEWEADLYKAEIKDGKLGTPQLHESDVSSLALFFNENEQITYYKDVNYDTYKGDMFVNGKEIDFDVRLWYLIAKGDMLLYYTDWNYDKSNGTLKMFKGGTKTKIADDVYDFDVSADGEILYLHDYSNNYNSGTLYRYNKGKPEKIADDVVELLWISDYKVRGDYSVW